MSDITIRSETEADYPAVADLIVEVFRETFGTGDEEASIVEQMRVLAPCISLVAVVDGELIGHLFISPVAFDDFPEVPVCTLGPVGVARSWQRQGVGTRLIQEGLAASRRAGYQVMTVTGDLNFYTRFGFVPIGETRLVTIFHTPHDMVLDLEPGTLARVSGLVDYPEPWHAFVEDENADDHS
jgi:putative acetyltransferase